MKTNYPTLKRMGSVVSNIGKEKGDKMKGKLKEILRFIILTIFLVVSYEGAFGQVGQDSLFCPGVTHTAGMLELNIDTDTLTPPLITAAMIGTAEGLNADKTIGGIDWMQIGQIQSMSPAFSPTNKAGSQLISWWSQNDGRNTLFQVTNASDSDVNVIVHIFNENCTMIRGFCDFYTGNDTHVYNLGDLVSNLGDDIPDSNLQDIEGIFVVTTVDDCPTPGQAIEHDHLAGSMSVLDPMGYMYGTNMYARQALCIDEFGEETVCGGPLIGASDSHLGNILPINVNGLFNIMNGSIAGSDVVVMNLSDDYGPPYTPIAATSDLDVVIYDDLENPTICGSTSACFIRLGIDENLVASQDFVPPTPQPFTVTVQKEGTGTGTVTSNPSGIDCGVDCSVNFDENSTITLTAVPDTDSEFTGWSGDADCSDGVIQNLTSDTTCIATFDLLQFTLTVTKEGSGSGTVTSNPVGIDCGADCSEDFDVDTVVTLTPVAESGSEFAGWSGNADCDDGIVTTDSAKTCTATFNLLQRTLTVNKAGGGDGNITSNPPGISCNTGCTSDMADFDINTTIMLTATPDGDSTFSGWSGDADCSDGELTMDAAKTCIATFTATVGPVEFTLTVEKDGTGTGIVTSTPPGINCGADCANNYSSGTTVDLTPTPDPGSQFSGWTGDPDCTDGEVLMDASKTCTATFTAIPNPVEFNLTVLKVGTGTGFVSSDPPGISCGDDCDNTYMQNTVVTLNPTASAGSTFSGWLGDLDCADGIVTMDSDITCTANFTSSAPPVETADLSLTKTGDPNPVDSGNELTYTLTITNNGPDTAANVSLTDNMPSGVVFVSASEECSNTGNNVSCSLGTLSNGSVTEVLITVMVNQPGFIMNSASVNSASTNDNNLENNTATAVTQVSEGGDTTDLLNVEAEFEEIETDGGSPISIPVMISNMTTDQSNAITLNRQLANGVEFTVELPDGFELDSLETSKGACDVDALECLIGEIGPGETVTVLVNMVAPQGEGVFNIIFLARTSDGQEFMGSTRVIVRGSSVENDDGGGCSIAAKGSSPSFPVYLLIPALAMVRWLGRKNKRKVA